MPEFSCGALVLAAGSSSRLGQPKQLVELDGESLLHRTARFALETDCDPVWIALGHKADEMQKTLLDLPVRTIVNPEWKSGMGSSLAFGVKSIVVEGSAPANLLLLVCDQLEVSADVLRALIRLHRLENRELTASQYGGKLGVPALFSARFYPELQAITGDKGARSILETYRIEAGCLDFPSGEKDLDTQDQMPKR
ncbi:nucleotidyltransferase family protein [Silvibacterium acidisoli]|uniref:nucleotidyltransferase family protein n=1 Tax=Acidobacteriaceae bacterium ZG23-2 TaxID=2883246 RepID=UPI00406C30B9